MGSLCSLCRMQWQVERLGKRKTVQDKAVQFVEKFTNDCEVECATLYCHHAMDHIPDQVRDAEVGISDLLQQSVEHSLKASKGNMHNFSNMQLRDEMNDKGRNFQVMAKEWERVHLKRKVAMPVSRNERRQMGDGSKEVEAAVDRARRKGLLVSRSNAQIDKKLQKREAKRAELVAKVLAGRDLTLFANLSKTLDNPPAGAEGSGVGTAGAGAAPAAEAPAAAVAEVPTAAAAAAEVPASRGSADLTATGRGATGSSRRGRGRGGAAAARGRGRGVTTTGRRIPKSAKPI
jgi:hypothetical protein